VNVASQIAVLICCAASTYFFFRGMVTAGLAARQLEAQQRLWARIGEGERADWIAFRRNQIQSEAERKASLQKISREAQVIHGDMQRTLEEIRRSGKGRRRDQRKAALKKLWYATGGRTYRASITLRRRIAGDRLLTPLERAELLRNEIRRKELNEEFFGKYHADVYAGICDGKISGLRDEVSGLEIFQQGAWRYVVVHEPLNEACARGLLKGIGSLRREDGHFVHVVLLTDNVESPTRQASELLTAEGIQVAEVGKSRADG